MRLAVIILNVLSVLAAIAVAPIAVYVGLWGLLGPAFHRPQDLALGLLVMATPFALTATCVFLSIKAMRAGRAYAPIIAAVPLLVATVGYLASPFAP